MTAPSLPSAHDVAALLKAQPDFFTRHADTFATLTVPHPHEGRAISLGERQILTLRERLHTVERRLAALLHNASDNERTMARMQEWSLTLLAARHATALPEIVAQGLSEHFDVPEVALRLWDTTAPAHRIGAPAPTWARPVSEDVRLFADSLQAPYCGTDTGFEAVQWLTRPAASIALIPLRTPDHDAAFGLLVLASPDPLRYAADMGTDVLTHIGALVGAALSRLLAAPTGATPVGATPAGAAPAGS